MAIQLDHSPVVIAIGALVLLLVGRTILLSLRNERKIRNLGSRAPRANTWVPWGLDFIAQSVITSNRHENLDFWHTLMRTHGRAARPFTIEASTVGQRIIFTIDEENIKAILATQFADYGKGPQMHADWHDFMGDGENDSGGGLRW